MTSTLGELDVFCTLSLTMVSGFLTAMVHDLGND